MFTTVLPTAMAGMMCHVAMISGQFHGVIEPHDADRLAVEFDSSLVVVFEHLDRHRDVGGVVGPGLHADSNREPIPLSGLPCLSGRKPGQLLGVFADFLPRSMTQRATLGVGVDRLANAVPAPVARSSRPLLQLVPADDCAG